MTNVFLRNSSAIVTFRVLFQVGSAWDPAGKEGVASLTAAMISEGGSRRMSYEDIVRTMYPMATGMIAQVDKEMTAFSGQSHIDNLDRYETLLIERLLEPGWDPADFERLRQDAINFLKVSLRDSNEEELAKEQLYNSIYQHHPYGHHNAGTIASLEKMTIEDVREFYRQHYSTQNLVLGLLGGFPEGLPPRMESRLAEGLSSEHPAALVLPPPQPIQGLKMEIIKKDFRGTAISLGFPISINRGDPDWPALFLAVSYLGQHRSSNSFLYKRLRQIRGLNYGDYAYLEYFPRGMSQFYPDPNLARHQQIFQVWIRPVEPQHGMFALKLAFYEVQKLIDRGMSAEDFNATRKFLSKYVNILTGTQDAYLGYLLDSEFYGIAGFNEFIRERLASLTLDDVNRAICSHLQTRNVKIVAVTADAEDLARSAVGNVASVAYNSPMPAEILAEDALVLSSQLPFQSDNIRIRPVTEIFEA